MIPCIFVRWDLGLCAATILTVDGEIMVFCLLVNCILELLNCGGGRDGVFGWVGDGIFVIYCYAFFI